ncbi:MAG: sulfur transferase domain-containing protein [Gemmatimonadales bacterium]
MALLDALAGTPNAAQPLPWLLTAGQPGPDQLRAAAAAGVTVVIDLRDPMEPRPFDEPALLRELGVEYLNFPVNSGALDAATLERILGAVRQHAGAPTLVHCASANRVGGALIPYFIHDEGMDEQAAIDAAMRIGLRSAELMEWGVSHARAHRPD